MSDVVIAPSQADARAAEAVVQHHAEMSGTLAVLTEALAAAVSGGSANAEAARGELARWCEAELLPHATAEEETLYPAAGRSEAGRLLVEGMLAEHEVIVRLVRDLAAGAGDLTRAAATAAALRVLFDVHLLKENELVVPLLQRTRGVSVAALLEGMHELLGEDGATGAPDGCGSGHGCACGEAEPAGHPELDVRPIPHAIRHATVLGALAALAPGRGLVLVAHHDPVPLLAQVEERWPAGFAVDHLERGPEAWRVQLVRRG